MDYELLTGLVIAIIIVASVALPLFIIGIVFYFMYRKRQRLKFLLENGTRGKAVVKTLCETGMIINDVPQISMNLKVTLPNIATYTILKTATIPMIYYPRIQPGMTIDVAADVARLSDQKYIGLIFE